MPQENDRKPFDEVIRAFKAEIANAGAHLLIDATVRNLYATKIDEMAKELTGQVKSGAITWSDAAKQAQENRNEIMNFLRRRSTPVGRSIAERLKRTGKSLNELIAKNAIEMHGSGVRFETLSTLEKNKIYERIVQSAGRSNVEVTTLTRRLGTAGRGLVVISVALAVYNIAVAENKMQAAGHEAATMGAGIAGGVTGGALAGLACGPGAPVCVTVGAFVGGALAALGVSWFW